MVSLQPRVTPQPAGIGEKIDGNDYNKDPIQTSLAGGLGMVRIPNEERTLFGLESVREFAAREGSGATCV